MRAHLLGDLNDIYFEIFDYFMTNFLHTHSWLNWVDEVGLKEKPEDTRYIKNITSKWDPKNQECEKIYIFRESSSPLSIIYFLYSNPIIIDRDISVPKRARTRSRSAVRTSNCDVRSPYQRPTSVWAKDWIPNFAIIGNYRLGHEQGSHSLEAWLCEPNCTFIEMYLRHGTPVLQSPLIPGFTVFMALILSCGGIGDLNTNSKNKIHSSCMYM